jgi:hypothetical protein
MSFLSWRRLLIHLLSHTFLHPINLGPFRCRTGSWAPTGSSYDPRALTSSGLWSGTLSRNSGTSRWTTHLCRCRLLQQPWASFQLSTCVEVSSDKILCSCVRTDLVFVCGDLSSRSRKAHGQARCRWSLSYFSTALRAWQLRWLFFFSQFLEPDVIRHSSSKFYFHIWKTMPHIEYPINGEHV